METAGCSGKRAIVQHNRWTFNLFQLLTAKRKDEMPVICGGQAVRVEHGILHKQLKKTHTKLRERKMHPSRKWLKIWFAHFIWASKAENLLDLSEKRPKYWFNEIKPSEVGLMGPNWVHRQGNAQVMNHHLFTNECKKWCIQSNWLCCLLGLGQSRINRNGDYDNHHKSKAQLNRCSFN